MLPRDIASFKAFENAMTLDIAMGGSTNTVLHLLAAAHEAEIDFTMADIDRLSRRVPVLCKVAPSVADVHVEDVHRAGGIMGILGELDRAGLLNRDVAMVHAESLEHALSAQRHQARGQQRHARILLRRAGRRADAGRVQPGVALRSARRGPRGRRHPRRRARLLEGWRPRRALRQSRADGCIVKTAGVDASNLEVRGAGEDLREPGRRGAAASSTARSSPATSWSSATRGRAAAPACRRCSIRRAI